MSALDVLLAVDAATTGVAQRRTTVRHRFLSHAPMTIVAYRMSGEAGAPLGVCFGTSEDDATVLVAPEPRNRAIRFREVLNPLAAALTNWLANFEHTMPVDGDPDREICMQAPQILVPNRATAGFVSSVLGRSLRYLKSSDDYPVPDATVMLGNHMTWFDQQAQVPGSCVLVAATDLLRRHWATGQSSLEDEDLHVLLGWIDPPAAATGAETAAVREVERVTGALPAIGPTADPIWDQSILEPALERFNRLRGRDDSADAVEAHGGPVTEVVAAALEPGWTATWAAHRLLMPDRMGPSVIERWEADKWAWTSHVLRVRDGMAFFRTTDTAKQAAFTLANFEEAQEALDIGEVIDDPLVLAGLVANGEALLGTVTDVDLGHFEPGKRKRWRPLVTLELNDPCAIPIGGKLAWIANVKVVADVHAIDGNTVTLRVFKGMGSGRPKAEKMPSVGSQAAFAPVMRDSPPRPRAPQDVPWTHIGAETPRPATEVPE